MNTREAARIRLRNQHITESRCTTPAEVVAAMGAMQAQDYLGALWSIGLRSPDATEAAVESAITDRKIVRSWPLRGTLHFIPAQDVRWMLEFFTPRVIASAATRHRQLELDEATFTRSRRILERALAGGECLTRDEIYALLERAKINPAGQRGYHILWRLAQEAHLCCGPRAGKQPTFVWLESWLSPGRKLDRDAAFSELAIRYFNTRGPATAQDFAWWSGIKLSDAKTALASIADSLETVQIDGTTYWLSASSPAPADPSTTLLLLPGFDELLLAYTDRSIPLAPEHGPKILPGNNGLFLPTIVRDGRVIGTWKRVLKGKSVTVSPNPFMPFKSTEGRAFETAAKRYTAYLDLPQQIKKRTANGRE